ncbi:hypothetical protein [Streptomyces sp. NPDC056632]|uniref:hypothetical protein n=1 Tax=Streptomyces sp. NPDC056632 TaxID=3345884 RepID=UPI00368D9894
MEPGVPAAEHQTFLELTYKATRPESYAIELLPEQIADRGITVVFRHSPELDAVLILWIIAGP